MKQAAKKQLSRQKVDGAIISEENGTIAFRKAPWNDTEVICEQPKVIPGRMVCSGEKGGDEFDFKPYERTGEKLFEEIFKTKHAVVRTTKRTVQVNYTFSRDLDKQDMLRYLKVDAQGTDCRIQGESYKLQKLSHVGKLREVKEVRGKLRDKCPTFYAK